MKLYRAVSIHEYYDFKTDETFRTADYTLEAKQFFRSVKAVQEFIRIAVIRSYRPPYKYILVIDVDNQCLDSIDVEFQNLDSHDALTIRKDDLPSFNNCISFVLALYV
jgi:hypothetical protein